MELRVLGCSGGIGAGLRTTALGVDSDILIDAGTGVGDLQLDEMAAVRHIFITHSHLDHLAGLPLLLDSVFERLQAPVMLYGQAATLEAIRRHIFNWVIWPDFSRLPQIGNGVIEFREMHPGESVTIAGRTLEMIPVNHAVPGVAYRVETAGGGAFAFSGDTTTNETLWGALNAHDRLDLLIVEAAFPDRDIEVSRKARHYTPSLLAADLVRLRHRPRILITHAKPGAEATILEECRSAIAGRDVELLNHGDRFHL